MGCCGGCCNNSYYCTSSLSNDTGGGFCYKCNGTKGEIFASATVRPTMKIRITNTGNCAMVVEFIKRSAGVVTTKTYNLNAGEMKVIDETNVTNVYVTGIFGANCCNYGSWMCGCANYCYYISGNYTIVKSAGGVPI